MSVEEIEVPPKSFLIYDVDSSSNSEKTEDIYKSHMNGSKISLATVSTEPYTQADESVEVLAKTMVTEQSTTFPYSQSDESIQFVSEEERQNEKECEEKNVTDATDEKEDIDDGEESVDKGAPSPLAVSPVENNGEQVKYSIDKGAPSPVLQCFSSGFSSGNNGEQVKYSVDKGAPSPVAVSLVENNGDKGAPSPVPVSLVENNREQVKYSVDTEPVSPAEKTREQGNNNVDKKSPSTESSTEMTEMTDSTDSSSTAPTDIQSSKATEYAAVFGPQPLPQLSPRQEDKSRVHFKSFFLFIIMHAFLFCNCFTCM